jgi:hypothetical protein
VGASALNASLGIDARLKQSGFIGNSRDDRSREQTMQRSENRTRFPVFAKRLLDEKQDK